MKTSNKIFIGIATLLILLVSTLLIAGKIGGDINPLAKAVKGSGIEKTETRNVPDFSGVHSSAGITVYLKQGKKSVEVEADDNILEYVKTEVKGDVLHVGYKKYKIKSKSKTKVYVSTPEIDELSASSGSDLFLESIIEADDLDLDVSSSGEIKGEIAAQEVEADVSSGGNIKVKGSSENIQINASSGGHFYGMDFWVQDADADVSSGGGIEIGVKTRLDANASSGGYIKYDGDPSVRQNKSSGGSIRGVR